MSRGVAIVCIVAGVPFALIDAWLSVQSLFGIIHPSNAIRIVVAIILGMLLTAVSVLLPVFHDVTSPSIASVAWVGFLIFDMVTTTIGIIWYGVSRQPLNSNVDLSRLQFVPDNAVVTALLLGFVGFVSLVCYLFGKGLRTLKQEPAADSE